MPSSDLWSGQPTSRLSPRRRTKISSRLGLQDSGNAATRLESHAVTGGTFTYGSYPDLDALFVKQAGELDYKRRAAILHQMQQIVSERAIYAPIWQLGFINGVGPRVAESGFGRIPGFPYTAPFEDLALNGG